MQPIVKTSQTDAVVEQIKTFLQSDSIAVGEKLPTEKKLCETLHVGRSTVREALRALQVMGYLQIQPSRGAFLVNKNLDDATPAIVAWLADHKIQIEDVVEVRVSLETLAAKLAAERASEEDIDKLDRIRELFEEALADKTYERLGKLDEEYHQRLVETSKNSFLAALNKTVSIAFMEFRNNSFRIKEHAANAVMPHRDIVKALRLRDADMAQIFVRRHLEKIREDQNNTIRHHESVRIEVGEKQR